MTESADQPPAGTPAGTPTDQRPGIRTGPPAGTYAAPSVGPYAGPYAGPDAGSTPPGATAAPPRPPRTPGFDDVWDTARRTRVRRPSDDRWVGGVCSGLARRLGVDPVLLRVLLVATVLLGGIGLVAYALALVLLPDHDGRIELERAGHGELTGTTVGAVALLLAGIVAPSPWELLTGRDLVSGGELLGALVVGTALLVGLALLPQLRAAAERSAARGAPAGTTGPRTGAATSTMTGPATGAARATGPSLTGPAGTGPAGTWEHTTPWAGTSTWDATTPSAPATRPSYGPPPAPRPPRPVRAGRRGPGPALSAAVSGLALAAAGATWLAAAGDVLAGRPQLLAACAALVVLGLALVGLGVAGRRDGGVGFTTFLVLVAVLAVLLVPSWRTAQLAGERTWTPATSVEAARGGSLGLGEGRLDLTALADLPPGSEVRVPVRVGIGGITVLVPDGMDVRVDAGALVGSTTVDGGDEIDGIGFERRLVADRDPQVVVDARTLVGTVRVDPVGAP